MLKKVLVVVICFVTICALFNLNDRLNYEGIQTALSIPQGSLEVVLYDLESFEVLFNIIEVYDPDSDNQEELYWTINDDGSQDLLWGKADLSPEELNSNSYWVLLDDTNLDLSSINANKIWTLARKFNHNYVPFDFDDPFLSLFESIALGWNYLSAIFSVLFSLLFDVLGSALHLLRAAFYLLGL